MTELKTQLYMLDLEINNVETERFYTEFDPRNVDINNRILKLEQLASKTDFADLLETEAEEILEDCRVCCIDGQPCSRHEETVQKFKDLAEQVRAK